MRRAIKTFAFLGACAFVFAAAQGQTPTRTLPSDLGPGEQGSTLKQPWLDTSPAPKSGTKAAVPGYIQDLLTSTGVPTATPGGDNRTSTALTVSPDINKDIVVTQQLGPWMILVGSYSTPDAAMLAREMALELRNNYKIPAYVYHYGAEEKRKEMDRVKAIIEKQKEFFKQNNLPTDQPIRVRHFRVEEHFGVLIGGYADQDAALRARDQLRKLSPPDPTKVKLDTKVYFKPDESDPSKAGQGERVYVNPFLRAFPVRNPLIKTERPADADKMDIAALRRMNSEEPYSLLKCKKPFTLVIKQFSVPTMVTPTSATSAGSFFETLGMASKNEARVDAAAVSANSLAGELRKAKLESYALHTKFSSLVTIGGFDSLEDPNLRAMAHLIETQLNPRLEVVQLLPKAMPMAVPR